jgi:hypothetical protein
MSQSAKTRGDDRARAVEQRLRQADMPDTSTPEFYLEAHRRSLTVAASRLEKEDQAFIDAISEGCFD